MNKVKAEIKFCPECGSAHIEQTNILAAADYSNDMFKCVSCEWVGRRDQLAISEITHQMGTNEDIFITLMNDLRNLLAKDVGVSLGGFLMKWGFISTMNPKILGRYLSAIARAILTAVLQERVKIEKEKTGGN